MIYALSGVAVIEGDHIVIRVAIEALPGIVSGGPHGPYAHVTHVGDAAKSIVGELNREAEDGTTLIHRAFDNAIGEAIENGELGIDMNEGEDSQPKGGQA